MEAQPQVFEAPDPFRGIDDAALGCRQDFGSRQGNNADSGGLEYFRGDAGDAVFEALEIIPVADDVLEPSQGLRSDRQDRKDHDLHVQDFLVELLVQFQTAAFVHPAQKVVMIHSERAAGRAAEKAGREVFSHPVGCRRVAAVDNAAVGGVQDLKSTYDRAGGEMLDLEPPGGDLFHRLGEHFEVLVGHQPGGPTGLYFQRVFLGLCRGTEEAQTHDRSDRDCECNPFLHGQISWRCEC